MLTDFVPSREADLVGFAHNFDLRINAGFSELGLTALQAQEFHLLAVAFEESYAICQNRMTRSPGNVAIKNEAKHWMISRLRMLAGIVQKCPTVTNGQRSDLGLTIRAAHSTRVPVPKLKPIVSVKSVLGMNVMLRLADRENPSGRARPTGVRGANLYSFVGDEPPSHPGEWKFVGSTTRTTITVDFTGIADPPAKVWLTACWFNPRSEVGPVCDPVFAYTQLGGTTVEAAVRLAA